MVHSREYQNTTTTVTDLAGRVVREIFEGANGGRRETVYGYDEHGRRKVIRMNRVILD